MPDFLSYNRRISDFDSVSTFPEGMIVTLIASGTNYQIDILDFITSLNAPGSVASLGDGVPVYNLDVDTNQIRAIETIGGIGSVDDVAGGITLDYGTLVESPQQGFPYTVINDSEIIISDIPSATFFVIFKEDAPAGSLVQVYPRGTASEAMLRTVDGSNFIVDQVNEGNSFTVPNLGYRAFRKVTDSLWMDEAGDG